MNILKTNVDSLNVIIFENRNKNYGAYVLRSTYGNTIFKSLGITVLIFAFLSITALLLSRTVDKEKVAEIGPNIVPLVPTYSVAVDVTPAAKPDVTALKHHVVSVIPNTRAVSTNLIDSAIERNIIQSSLNTNNTVAATTTGNIDSGDNGNSGGDPNANGDNGNNTSNTNGNTTATNTAPDVFPSLENLPAFLQRNLRYPEMAKDQFVQGKVLVNFIIDEEGKILKATVLSGIGYGCDEEALRVIKLMPKWKPGMAGGKPVKVSFTQPITFRLQ
ncbi:MAG TPA: energy transducer TonB [Bacteroidia bacterium]